MKCYVCKKDFIISKTVDEFFSKKLTFDTEMCKVIEDEFNLGEDYLWDKLLSYEALLLYPNTNPRFCIAGKCNAIICNYCFNKNKINHEYCVVCKIPPPLFINKYAINRIKVDIIFL